MSSKAELAALAEATNGETPQALTIVNAQSSVQALSTMSNEDFDSRLAALKVGRERIARVQREYMNENEDYGLIPNTPKPTLFKSGAEKLAQLYGLAARVESKFVQGDGEVSPPLTFNAEAYLHVGSFDGPIVAVGHGTANSWEKRYRRESKVCPNCGKQGTVIKGKAEYGGGWLCWQRKDGCGTKFADNDPAITEQATNAGSVMDAYDLGVTLLKMSEKRAFVDAVLRATATSGLFTQDVTEDPPEAADTGFGPTVAQRAAQEAQEPTVRVTQDAAPQTGGTLSPPQGMIVGESGPETIRPTAGLTEEQFDQVVQATGGEVIEVGPSTVEGVERGGHTSQANEAQIAEIRRLAGELGWQSKQILGFAYALDPLIAPDTEVPQDGRVARGELTAYLEGMQSGAIGSLIQALSAEASRDRDPEQVDHE